MKVELIRITENPIDVIYQCFRICYAKNTNNIELENHKTAEDKINFFMPMVNAKHETPLEAVSFTFKIENISRACLTQLTRHRTFKFNVQSQRYVNANNFKVVMPSSFKGNEKLEEAFIDYCNNSIEMYNWLIKNGATKEDARAILPNATTCNLILSCDLRNFRHFLGLRLCNHAQAEIKELAKQMSNLIRPHIPFVAEGVMNCKYCGECYF